MIGHHEEQEIAALVREHFQAKDVTDAVGEIGKRFVKSRDSVHRGHIAAVSRSHTIGLDDEVEVRQDITTLRTKSDDEMVSLLFDGSGVDLPKRVEPMIEFILDATRFRVGDLPSQFSEKTKKVVVQYLVKEGLLTFASESLSTSAEDETSIG